MLQKLSAIVYKVIGPQASTHLAYSPLGKIVFTITNNPFKKKNIYTTKEDIKIELTKDEAFRFGISYLGTINQFETNVLKKIIKKNDIVFDIGAYVDAWYTLLASKLIGIKGHVYSFEPHPEYFKRVQRQVSLNNLTNVATEELCLSDKNGSVTFYEAEEASSMVKKQANEHTKGKPKEFSVKIITLDNYIKKQKIKHVDLVKIDVEGAEMQVLRGAKSVLKKQDAPNLLVEVVDHQLKLAGSSAKEVITYLQSFGYIPHYFSKTGLTASQETKRSETLNIYFSKNPLSLKF